MIKTADQQPVTTMVQQGYDFVPGIVSTDVAEAAHRQLFDTTQDGRAIKVINPTYAAELAHLLVDPVSELFQDAGFDEWVANRVQFMQTPFDQEPHFDKKTYRVGIGMLYLSGAPRVDLLDPDGEKIESKHPKPGDLVLARGALFPDTDEFVAQPEVRQRHAVQSVDARSLLHIGYKTTRQLRPETIERFMAGMKT